MGLIDGLTDDNLYERFRKYIRNIAVRLDAEVDDDTCNLIVNNVLFRMRTWDLLQVYEAPDFSGRLAKRVKLSALGRSGFDEAFSQFLAAP